MTIKGLFFALAACAVFSACSGVKVIEKDGGQEGDPDHRVGMSPDAEASQALEVFVVASAGCRPSQIFASNVEAFIADQEIDGVSIFYDGVPQLENKAQLTEFALGSPTVFVLDNEVVVDAQVGYRTTSSREDDGLTQFRGMLERHGLWEPEQPVEGFDFRADNDGLREAKVRRPGGGAFHESNLDGMDLSGLDFRRGSFSGASLRGADLRGADFRDAVLSFADLEGAVVDSETRFDGVFWFNTRCTDGSRSEDNDGVCEGMLTSVVESNAEVSIVPNQTDGSTDVLGKVRHILSLHPEMDYSEASVFRLESSRALELLDSISRRSGSSSSFEERFPEVRAALESEDSWAVLVDARELPEREFFLLVLIDRATVDQYNSPNSRVFDLPMEEEVPSSFIQDELNL